MRMQDYVVRMQEIQARRLLERDHMERVKEIREVFIIDSDVTIR